MEYFQLECIRSLEVIRKRKYTEYNVVPFVRRHQSRGTEPGDVTLKSHNSLVAV
jgi:hypothetical protein